MASTRLRPSFKWSLEVYLGASTVWLGRSVHNRGMTTAISYESESKIIEADGASQLLVGADQPHRRFVKIIEADGVIRLVPLDLLHESERAILENEELYSQTRQGLEDFKAGKSVSSDWLFADDE